ncbi:MAG: hypothetical protein IK005_10020 [Paludibacteraceae bacterium]|nr:hypothetical protein [Paludibacteraceae bacterium]
MNTIKRYLLSVLFLCVSLSAFSQASVYPIQLSAAMLPPYTNCMGDYFSNGRVQLKVIVRDMSRYDASLEYSISVKIKQGGRVVLESKGPLKRRFSQAQIVNDISLRDLFSDRNNYTVTGGASGFFDNGYCLEEGSYEFEYQLFDKNNGKMPLSEPFSVYCYLTQAEPPVGVFPEDGKCYEKSELPQTFLFQWIDPIAIGPQNRSYELHIKEKNGTDMKFTGNMFSTQDAPSSMEVYNQNVYNNNFVLINNSSGKFEVGNTYYWYVQTKSVADGIHGQNAYKNNGKSQTYSFSIGNCHQEEPKIDFDDSKAKNKAKTKVRIELDEVKVEGDVVTPKWELKSNKDNELICGFKIYCYKAGGNPDDASEVKNMTSICNQFKEGDIWTDNLNSSVLEKGVEYFCFVRPVVKDGAIGLKSNEISFKLASPNASSSSKNEDDGCGVDLEHRPCEELLTTVPKYFFANDGHQVILVDQTTKLEGDAFTGAGIITPAWLKNMVPDVMPLTGLNVEFEKIKINSDGYLCEGEIKVVSDPATNLYFDLNELVDFKAGSDAAAKQREVYTKEVDKKEDIKGDVFNGQIVHEKSTGDLYAVPMGGGTPEKVAKCLNKREYCPLQYRGALNDAGIYLRFDVDATLNDGYSPYIDKEAKPFTAENILNGYVSSGSDYIQPWISMVQGETKYIKAYFEGGSVDPDDVEFYLISQNSLALLEKSYENGYFKVRIYGGQPTRSLQIVARSKAKKKDCSDGNNSDSKDGNATNTDTNAGTNGNSASSDNDSNKNSNDCKECEAVTYGSAQIYMLSSKKIKVMLVPVVQNATNNNLNIDDLKAKVSAANDIINQRFAPLGRQFELVVDGAFEYKDIDTNTGFNVSEDNSEWTKETEEMKALRKAYGLKVGKRDEYQACLFLLTQAQKEGLQGYMPRSNSVGFIFLGDNFANVQSDIMAHELCHGLFGLQHTFAYAGVTEGDVKENLMDYVAHNDERYLSKYFQWNNMERFNGHVFKLLDDVEDGEATDDCKDVLFGSYSKTPLAERYLDDNNVMACELLKMQLKSSFDAKSYFPYGKSSWLIQKNENNLSILENIKNNNASLSHLKKGFVYTSFGHDIFSPGNGFNSQNGLSFSGLIGRDSILVNIFVYKDNINLTNYKVEKLNQANSKNSNIVVLYSKCDPHYILIFFYDEDQNLQLMIQIYGGYKLSKAKACDWAQYLLQKMQTNDCGRMVAYNLDDFTYYNQWSDNLKDCNCYYNGFTEDQARNNGSWGKDDDNLIYICQKGTNYKLYNRVESNKCCNPTCKRILSQKGLKPQAPGDATSAIDYEYPSNSKILKSTTSNLTKLNQAIDIIEDELSKGHPVLTGVHHLYKDRQRLVWVERPWFNENDRPSMHYLLIKGKEFDNHGTVFYRFYEVGKRWNNDHCENVFSVTDGFLSSNPSYQNYTSQENHGKYYILTTVRKNLNGTESCPARKSDSKLVQKVEENDFNKVKCDE